MRQTSPRRFAQPGLELGLAQGAVARVEVHVGPAPRERDDLVGEEPGRSGWLRCRQPEAMTISDIKYLKCNDSIDA